MTDEINVLHRDQTIYVEPASGAVSVIAAGPQGPPGPPGAASTVPGPPGPAGAGTNTPKGVSASGTLVSQPVINAPLNLSSIIAGPASWLAANTLTIPAGAAGLYLILCDLAYRSDAVVGIAWEISKSDGSSHTPFDLRTAVSHSASTWVARYQSSFVKQCAVGDTFQVRSRGNTLPSPGTMQVVRLSLVRLGDSFAP
jgi:hypothetical protein